MDVDFIRLVIHDFTYSPVSDGTQFSENYTWEIWGHPIFIVFYPPTDANGTYLIDRRYTNVNVSLAETGTAILEWNGANRSLNGSGTNWRVDNDCHPAGLDSLPVVGEEYRGAGLGIAAR